MLNRSSLGRSRRERGAVEAGGAGEKWRVRLGGGAGGGVWERERGGMTEGWEMG